MLNVTPLVTGRGLFKHYDDLRDQVEAVEEATTTTIKAEEVQVEVDEEDFFGDEEKLQLECKAMKWDTKFKSDSVKKPRGVRGEQLEGGGIRCKHCGVVCADAREAKRHRAYFHYRTKKCPHCDFVGHAEKALELHIKARHEGVRDQQCPQCDFATPYPWSLAGHVKTVHQKAKDKVCHICGFATVYGYALAAHKKSAHEKSRDFACDLCEYATHTKQALKSHVRAVHERVRDNICDLCGYATLHKQALRSHLRSKHGIEFDCGPDGFGLGSNRRFKERHRCDKCNYTTAYTGCLIRHREKEHPPSSYIEDLCLSELS